VDNPQDFNPVIGNAIEDQVVSVETTADPRVFMAWHEGKRFGQPGQGLAAVVEFVDECIRALWAFLLDAAPYPKQVFPRCFGNDDVH
jgi:hypothetical protein